MRFLDFIKLLQKLYITENVCLLFPKSFDWNIFRSNKSFERLERNANKCGSSRQVSPSLYNFNQNLSSARYFVNIFPVYVFQITKLLDAEFFYSCLHRDTKSFRIFRLRLHLKC